MNENACLHGKHQNLLKQYKARKTLSDSGNKMTDDMRRETTDNQIFYYLFFILQHALEIAVPMSIVL